MDVWYKDSTVKQDKDGSMEDKGGKKINMKTNGLGYEM